MIVFRMLKLKGTVRGIHREEKKHQNDLRDEDKISISFWPTPKIFTYKSFNSDNISPYQKNYAGNKNSSCKDFETIN